MSCQAAGPGSMGTEGCRRSGRRAANAWLGQHGLLHQGRPARPPSATPGLTERRRVKGRREVDLRSRKWSSAAVTRSFAPKGCRGKPFSHWESASRRVVGADPAGGRKAPGQWTTIWLPAPVIQGCGPRPNHDRMVGADVGDGDGGPHLQPRAVGHDNARAGTFRARRVAPSTGRWWMLLHVPPKG